MNNRLESKRLCVEIQGKRVVNDAGFRIRSGELHLLVGPNGSGKSSLALAMMGHPAYRIVSGHLLLNGKSLEKRSPDQRAKAGLFLSFQHPVEIEGVTIGSFLRSAVQSIRGEKVSVAEFRETLDEHFHRLGIDPSFRTRPLNKGFSGGEKKRMEMLQLSVLRPKFAILDETDAGLDIDALAVVIKALKKFRRDGMGLLVITHSTKIGGLLKPDRVHVMAGGRVVATDGRQILKRIEEKGYGGFKDLK